LWLSVLVSLICGSILENWSRIKTIDKIVARYFWNSRKQAAGHFDIFASAPNFCFKPDPYLNLSSSALDAAGIEIKKPMIKTDL